MAIIASLGFCFREENGGMGLTLYDYRPDGQGFSRYGLGSAGPVMRFQFYARHNDKLDVFADIGDGGTNAKRNTVTSVTR